MVDTKFDHVARLFARHADRRTAVRIAVAVALGIAGTAWEPAPHASANKIVFEPCTSVFGGCTLDAECCSRDCYRPFIGDRYGYCRCESCRRRRY
jgi:hypothetical protein